MKEDSKKKKKKKKKKLINIFLPSGESVLTNETSAQVQYQFFFFFFFLLSYEPSSFSFETSYREAIAKEFVHSTCLSQSTGNLYFFFFFFFGYSSTTMSDYGGDGDE